MSNRYQFHFSALGQPKQPVILFLHGFLGDCREFESVIQLLSTDFRCLSVDLPGHGLTQVTGEEDYTMPRTAAALVNWLNQLGIKSCYLVGYSMGGRLALYLALNFPQCFPKVVLESASPGLKTAAERQQRRQRDRQLAEELATGNFREFVQRWYDQPLFASLKKHPQFEQLLERRLQGNSLQLAHSLAHLGLGDQPSLWEKLPEAQVSLLLLVGEADQKFLALNQEMAQSCPVAQLYSLPGCGHNLHLEDSLGFAEILKNFFRG